MQADDPDSIRGFVHKRVNGKFRYLRLGFQSLVFQYMTKGEFHKLHLN